MGRHSGFIAAWLRLPRGTSISFSSPKKIRAGRRKRIPENSQGKNQSQRSCGDRRRGRRRPVFFEKKQKKDAYGHVKFGDIGIYLKNKINEYFANENIEINLKYIDPSYLIRSVPSNTYDGLFAATLGQNAVHAAMSGFTDTLVSAWHGVYCYVPLELVTRERKSLDLDGRLWLSVLESTGQPEFVND